MDDVLTIGIHMTAGDELTRRLIAGILDFAAEQPGLKIRDFCYPGDSPDQSLPPPWLGKVDGMVVCVPRTNGVVAWLQGEGGAHHPCSAPDGPAVGGTAYLPPRQVPVVTLGSDMYKVTYSVSVEPRSTARLAVEHLTSLGLRQFAYVGLRSADGSTRLADSLARELAKHGLKLQSYHTEVFLSGTYRDFDSLDDLEPELVRMIRDAKKPLAVVALNDRLASAVCRIAAELGLVVPDAVAVLGIGDTEITRVSAPPISTIRLPIERIGYEGARLAHRLVLGQRPRRRSIRVPVQELVARQSTVGKQRAATTDIERALEFIRARACEGIRVDHVAAHVGVPLRTFEIQFAAATGRTVGEQIRGVRLESAKVLLSTTDLPLERIAQHLGMKAGSNLSGFFRRSTGVAPAEYRRQNRK